MDYITQEVIDKAKKALEKDDLKEFFEAFGFNVFGDICIGNVKEPNGVELESYTDAGGDMIITLDISEDWKENFRKYVENFEIDEEVSIWWPNGVKGRDVPFNNMKEHYDDLEEWVNWLKDIVRIMEGKDPLEDEPSEEELEAVRKWVYWSYNYFEPAKFIKDIWGEGPFADHMMKKFIGYNANMNRFYAELDKENQRKLAEYVLKNYNPG